MSTLEFYTTLTALWLSLAWVPYILDRILVRGFMETLANPNSDQVPQSAWAQRAKRAHYVSVETFVVFAPLAVIAMIRMPDDAYAGTLAMTYFIGIFAHYIVYMLGIILIRTLAFALAALSATGLALHLLGIT
ncbi:MAPEG family protein [Pseudopelagicola sp. nBUS_19]|uniref:MAPEG family protein n=1 Tax=unclassified Pseudopelagicola TaxID=2649563 RepID=UPI003EC011B6